MTTPFNACRNKIITTVYRTVVDGAQSVNFDAQSWADTWLNEPLRAIGTTPREYILAGHDCEVLVNLLLRMESGSFS